MANMRMYGLDERITWLSLCKVFVCAVFWDLAIATLKPQAMCLFCCFSPQPKMPSVEVGLLLVFSLVFTYHWQICGTWHFAENLLESVLGRIGSSSHFHSDPQLWFPCLLISVFLIIQMWIKLPLHAFQVNCSNIKTLSGVLFWLWLTLQNNLLYSCTCGCM